MALCVLTMALEAIKIGKLNCFSQHLATIIRSISLSVSEWHYMMITLSHKVLQLQLLIFGQISNYQVIVPHLCTPDIVGTCD